MPDNPLTLLTAAEAERIGRELLSYTSARASVTIQQTIGMTTRFSRNDVRNMESEGQLQLHIMVHVDGRMAGARTTRTDSEGLKEAAKAAEEAAGKADVDHFLDDWEVPTRADFTDPPIYLDSSVRAGESAFQGETVRSAAATADKEGLVAAGSLRVNTVFLAMLNSAGFSASTRRAYSEFTATVRTRNGKGSGWAWGGGEDFANVRPEAVTARAIELCQKSDNPVAVEPGRYTVIMEPEAVAQLLAPVTGDPTQYMSADAADAGWTVYSKQGGGNKLGLRMMDTRVQLTTDPRDPDLPFSPLVLDGSLHGRVEWFKDGVLTNLALLPWYAHKLNRPPLWHPDGRAHWSVNGPTQSLEEMIAGTRRGIWVHHFATVAPATARTLLLSGVTRDGTFLIENGKITRPIKNLRFNESPFFFMNKIDAFGSPVRAASGLVVPRLKVHDFEFTSMSDAI